MNNDFYYYPSKGLDILTPNPIYSGMFETIEEYEDILQDDTRPKPEQNDLTCAAINLLKHEISEMVSSDTVSIIYYGFSFSLFPNIKIWSTIFWQNNLTNMYLLKDTTCISYPLNIKVSEDSTNGLVSISLNNENELKLLFEEFYTYKESKLKKDSDIKENISNLSLQELLLFKDTRLTSTQY